MGPAEPISCRNEGSGQEGKKLKTERETGERKRGNEANDRKRVWVIVVMQGVKVP